MGFRLCLAAVLMAAPLAAQRMDRETFWDMQLVRSHNVGYDSLFKGRAGIAGVKPQDENPAEGREDAITFDGYAYFHAENVTEQQATIDLYAGPDGAILSAREGDNGAEGTRVEVWWRYLPFYREGFYTQDDQWAPTGRYGGQDYGVYLGFGTSPDTGFVLEGGPYYERKDFERNDTTSNSFVVPEDYNAYGVRTYFEQNTIQTDREYGEPIGGFLATVRIDLEFNDSNQPFGTPLYTSTLASQYWRGMAHFELYLPTGGSSAVEVRFDGIWTDDKDRVFNNDTIKQIGYLWADARVGWRLRMGPLRLIPFGHLQWTRTLDEFGNDTNENFWYGGGIRTRLNFGDSVFAYADYSYLNNPNRPTITFDEDIWGEHQFFAGIEVNFGSQRAQ